VEEAGAAPLAPALSGAADLPLEIAEAAADTAALAALVAEHANPDARPDAAGAALLAAGAVSVAAHLVEANLAVLAEDKRAARAQELTALAEDACRRALAATD
jgi:formiminotetrahydrofolate cyclodeaminase